MNAVNPKPQDPSMEDILASIRRIIADDQEPDQGDPAKGVAHEPARIDPTVSEGAASLVDDDVLDLADLSKASATLPADLEIDVPELSFSEAVSFGSSIGDLGAPVVPDGTAPTRVERRGNTPVERTPTAVETVAQDISGLESLISNQATASIGQAFNILSNTVLSRNARTLEDLVTEMLKPMLKVWLDDNLPPMVERLVRTEIERVARGGR